MTAPVYGCTVHNWNPNFGRFDAFSPDLDTLHDNNSATGVSTTEICTRRTDLFNAAGYLEDYADPSGTSWAPVDGYAHTLRTLADGGVTSLEGGSAGTYYYNFSHIPNTSDLSAGPMHVTWDFESDGTPGTFIIGMRFPSGLGAYQTLQVTYAHWEFTLTGDPIPLDDPPSWRWFVQNYHGGGGGFPTETPSGALDGPPSTVSMLRNGFDGVFIDGVQVCTLASGGNGGVPSLYFSGVSAGDTFGVLKNCRMVFNPPPFGNAISAWARLVDTTGTITTDHMTEADGTNLYDHTIDFPVGWVPWFYDGGTYGISIVNNRAAGDTNLRRDFPLEPPSGFARYGWGHVPESVSVSAVLHVVSQPSGIPVEGGVYMGPGYFRGGEFEFSYRCDTDTLTRRWELRHFNNDDGTFSLLGFHEQTLTVDTDYAFSLHIDGASVSAFVAGVQVLTHTNTEIEDLSSAEAGVYLLNSLDVQGYHLDDFDIEDLTPPMPDVSGVHVRLGYSGAGVTLFGESQAAQVEYSSDGDSWTLVTVPTLPDHGGSVLPLDIDYALPTPIHAPYWRACISVGTSTDANELHVYDFWLTDAAGYEIDCTTALAPPTPPPVTCPTFNGFSGDAGLLIRNIPSGLATILLQSAVSLCVCVKLARKDGVTLGFTTHDEDLSFDTLSFEAASSIESTALRQQTGNGIDNLDVMGLLSSDKITEEDLRGQRYDGAEIKLYVVDWTNVVNRVLVLRGSLGEVTLTDGQYKAEVRSLMQRLTQQVGRLTSPLCRWLKFGDSNCAKDLTALTFTATVDHLGSAPRLLFVAFGGGFTWPAGAHPFSYGTMRATSGPNAGLEREIKEGDFATLKFELEESFPFPLSPGVTLTIIQGCDRTFTDCTQYANILNFGGEPYVPGLDHLARTGRHA